MLHEVLKRAEALLQDEVAARSLADLTRQWDPAAPRLMCPGRP